MSFSNLLYEQTEKLYTNKKEILVNVKNILKMLDLNNIHQYFYVYCYLLWNGYFSVTKHHEYNDINIDTELDNRIENNYTIFTGKGVCRHFAEFLNEILSEVNYDSKQISIRLNNHNIKTLMNIKRIIGEHEDHDIYDNGKENHSVVLTKEDNELFILDPTILCECIIMNNGKLISYSGQYNIDEKLFKTNIYKNIDNNKIQSSSNITKKKLLEYYKYAERICLKNKILFEEYYKETKPKYEKNLKLINFFK